MKRIVPITGGISTYLKSTPSRGRPVPWRALRHRVREPQTTGYSLREALPRTKYLAEGLPLLNQSQTPRKARDQSVTGVSSG